MSTILEALKKAEQGRERKTLGERIVVSPPEPPRRRGVLILFGVAILLILFSALLLYVSGRVGPVENGVEVESVPIALPVAVSVDTQQEEETVVLPELEFSGVIWDGVEHIAIVNGKPLTSGQEIEGVKIVKIDLENVKVLYNGESYNINLGLR